MALDVDVLVTSRTSQTPELPQDLRTVADKLGGLPEYAALAVPEAQLALVEDNRVHRRVCSYSRPGRFIIKPGTLRLLVHEERVLLDLDEGEFAA